MTRESVWSLIRSVEVLLRSLDNSNLSEFMEHWPDSNAEFKDLAPRPLPVLQWLEEARQNGPSATAPALQHLCNYADELFWGQTYSVGTFGDAFLERYGWCELIGASGPVAAIGLPVVFSCWVRKMLIHATVITPVKSIFPYPVLRSGFVVIRGNGTKSHPCR